MIRLLMGLCAAALVAGCANTSNTAESGVERMYVLYCGEGTAPDKARWTPGVAENLNKPITLSNSCYLIKHAKGWMLWETGYSESIVGKPDGYPTPVLHWYLACAEIAYAAARRSRPLAERHSICRLLARASRPRRQRQPVHAREPDHSGSRIRLLHRSERQAAL